MLTAVVGGAVYTQYSGSGFNPGKVLSGFYNSIIGLLSPNNLNSAAYAFIATGLGLYSGVLLFGSHEVGLFSYSWALSGSQCCILMRKLSLRCNSFVNAKELHDHYSFSCFVRPTNIDCASYAFAFIAAGLGLYSGLDPTSWVCLLTSGLLSGSQCCILMRKLALVAQRTTALLACSALTILTQLCMPSLLLAWGCSFQCCCLDTMSWVCLLTSGLLSGSPCCVLMRKLALSCTEIV